MENSILYVPLTQGQAAIVDLDDSDLVRDRLWQAEKTPNGAYYGTRKTVINGKSTKLTIHCLVLEKKIGRKLVKGEVADHVNGNTLDCRASNLRLATRSQNRTNSKINKNNTSGIIGVQFSKRWNRWVVRLTVNGKQTTRNFKNLEDAISARREYEDTHFGDFVRRKGV